MAVSSYVIYNAALPIRIAAITITAATLIAVVASGIAIGIVVSHQTDPDSPFTNTKIVLRSDIRIAIDRPIANFELPKFYNASATLIDLTTSLNEQLKQFYPQTAIKIVISAFSDEPILISNLKRRLKKQTNNLYGNPSIVTLNGSAYFTQTYTGDDIRKAFNNYSRTIVLTNIAGKPSSALSTFSSKYSIFTDTYATNLTIEQIDTFVSITLTNTTTLNNSTTPTVTMAIG